MKKPLVLFGTGDFAVIAHEYFKYDSDYEVIGFTVDEEYADGLQFKGLPLVPFEYIHGVADPATTHMHVCLIYNDMNRLRAKKIAEAKTKGYKLASYISSRAFVSPTAQSGEHNFIFESNVIQSDVMIGNNNILWSNNHVGHSSRIGNDNYISSHVVLSGHCTVGNNVFIGVNSTIANNAEIGSDTWISHGSIINGTVPPGSMVKPIGRSEIVPLNEEALARALERASAKASS